MKCSIIQKHSPNKIVTLSLTCIGFIEAAVLQLYTQHYAAGAGVLRYTVMT